MDFAAIIVAAGRGTRAGGAKQWRNLAGRAVARWSLEALLSAGARHVVVVVTPGHEGEAAAAFAGLSGWSTVTGGAERFDSVRAGLAAIGQVGAEAVLIHDAARPFVSGAIPTLPAVDTLKRRQDSGALITADRDGLMRAQTPQAFRYDVLMAAIGAWPAGETPTDDAQVLDRAGKAVATTSGDPMLFKLTYPEDFAMAQALAGGQTRIGQGFDVHAFGPGDHVWLCGVRIDHDRALVGNSDADAGLHALTDALLGAVGEGDIGDHFPPTDSQWKDADSGIFLKHAAGLIAGRGGRIINVDVTLICETPKIKPHRAAMRARIAGLLAIPVEQVSVKATTTESLGFTGRGEGIAAQAAVAVEIWD